MNLSMLNKIPKMHLIQNKIIHFMLKDGTIHSAPAIKIPPKYFYYHSFIFFIKAEPTKLIINILSKVMPHGTVNISSFTKHQISGICWNSDSRCDLDNSMHTNIKIVGLCSKISDLLIIFQFMITHQFFTCHKKQHMKDSLSAC